VKAIIFHFNIVLNLGISTAIKQAAFTDLRNYVTNFPSVVVTISPEKEKKYNAQYSPAHI